MRACVFCLIDEEADAADRTDSQDEANDDDDPGAPVESEHEHSASPSEPTLGIVFLVNHVPN